MPQCGGPAGQHRAAPTPRTLQCHAVMAAGGSAPRQPHGCTGDFSATSWHPEPIYRSWSRSNLDLSKNEVRKKEGSSAEAAQPPLSNGKSEGTSEPQSWNRGVPPGQGSLLPIGVHQAEGTRPCGHSSTSLCTLLDAGSSCSTKGAPSAQQPPAPTAHAADVQLDAATEQLLPNRVL